jgi:GntR family transcriptional regulator
MIDKMMRGSFPDFVNVLAAKEPVPGGGGAAALAGALGIAHGSEVIRIHRIRVLNDRPVINEYIILPAQRFPEFSLDMERLPNTLYEFYYQKFGIMVIKAREELGAVLPTSTDQKYLHCPAGTPLLEVRRKAFDIEGNVVELRRSRIDTESHHYRIELH